MQEKGISELNSANNKTPNNDEANTRKWLFTSATISKDSVSVFPIPRSNILTTCVGKKNIYVNIFMYTRCSSLALFVSFIPLVSSGTDDERCEAHLPTRECRAGQWKHQQRETMSHDSAVNNALFLFIFFPHPSHDSFIACFLHYIWNSCFACLYVNPLEFNSFDFLLTFQVLLFFMVLVF